MKCWIFRYMLFVGIRPRRRRRLGCACVEGCVWWGAGNHGRLEPPAPGAGGAVHPPRALACLVSRDSELAYLFRSFDKPLSSSPSPSSSSRESESRGLSHA